MFLGFDFSPDTALENCTNYLETDDIDLEHLETQRASIAGMLNHDYLMDDNQRETLRKVEKKLYKYLCENGAVSSPVLLDEPIGGDLLNIPFKRGGN
jgi:hypothetical protein